NYYKQKYCLRTRVNLRPWMTKIEQQGDMGSCAAEAIAGAIEYLYKRYAGVHVDVSRLFIYFNAMVIGEKTVHLKEETGSSINDAIEGVVRYGVCEEKYWQHKKILVIQRPSIEAYRRAAEVTIIPLKVEPTIHSMKKCLNNNLPFVVGFHTSLLNVDDIQKVNGGYLRNAGKDENHAVLVVGYNDNTQLFLVRNSWGEEWGDEGYFVIPYKYLTDWNYMVHGTGIWAIRNVIPRPPELQLANPFDFTKKGRAHHRLRNRKYYRRALKIRRH
ncbi:unnamed protein product, partial [Didymodactylos carnosus]